MKRPYGFNFQWIFVWQPGLAPLPPDEKALDFLAENGFNFVRIPCDYRFWTRDFDYLHPDEKAFEHLDGYLEACRSRGLHMSLNIHRAPGYCINSNHLEKHNLWLDDVAQEGFAFQWEALARRFKGVSSADLSFDLVNEPPDVGQYGMTRDNHAAIIRKVVARIRSVDPERTISIDGLSGGNLAMPELADLGVSQTCRGYQPMTVSHYEASWWPGSKGLPEPAYPGCEWEGKRWDRSTIRDYYEPWVSLQKQGVGVYVGEFGCYNKTRNEVALAWFRDLFSVFKELKWGYVMWGFEGAFGIIDHGRPGARIEEFKGYRVDRDLLDLMLQARVSE